MPNRGSDEAGARDISVLVVDDSAVVRQVMTSILSQSPGFAVTVAADPIIAREKIKRTRPDVIVLDLEMPRMDGLTFLRQQMSEDPIPVVVCSSHTEAGSEAAFRALEDGAVEIVTKPKLGVQSFFEESATRLLDTIRAARAARLSLLSRRRGSAGAQRARVERHPSRGKPRPSVSAQSVIAIGASTGGTEALRTLLEAMPADAPGIVVVQHMPESFTRAFAERLDESCAICVREARDGDPVLAGQALVAPGNHHLLVHEIVGRYVTEVRSGPPVSRHRPSVDMLFRSVSAAAGPHAIGVILTGMGEDGAAGLLEMRRAGAMTIAQDEATCVVFGMPREAILRGAAEQVLPLPQIAGAALLEARRRARHAPDDGSSAPRETGGGPAEPS